MLHGTRIASDEWAFDVAQPSQAATAGAPGADGHITVPDAHLLFSGDFQRSGPDLKIVGEDGNAFLIPDYFRSEKRATLLSPEGASLAPDVVEALAGPLAPGQYAQAGAQTSDQPAIGRIEQVAGNATIVRNGVAITANQGDVVRKGDIVQTGSDGQIAVLFSDGSTFSLSASARMVLNDFVYQAGAANNSALISLVQGTIGFVAGQLAKTGDMRVDTPVATMGIRGTAVLVEISANDGQTKFSVMMEPDGTTGSFNLYNKTTGALIATVNNSSIGWMVTPTGPLQILAQQIQKTQAELAQELGYVQQLFNFFNQGQQNPFNPDDHTNVNPKTQFAGTGTQFLTTLPAFTFQEIVNHLTNPVTFSFTPPVVTPPDPQVPSVPDIINVSVTPNRPPVAVDDPDGLPGIGDVLPNDTDPEGGVITVTSVQFLPDGTDTPVEAANTEIQGKYGKLIISPNGSYTYVPYGTEYDRLTAGDNVTELFKYTISDPFGATASATLTINIEGVNDAPEAVADIDGVQAAGFVDGQPTLGDPIATGNVLINDTDIDTGDTKKVVGVKAGDHTGSEGGVSGHVNAIIQGKYGFLVLLENGKYIYTLNNLDPDTIRLGEGEIGQDVFTYTMADAAGETSTTTLVIDVTGANSAPVITGGVRTGSVTEDAPTDWVSGTLAKTDIDNDDTAANDVWAVDLRQGQTRVDSHTVQGTYGTFTIDQNGKWTYTLDNSLQATQALQNGDRPVETFTVRVTDSHGAHDTQTVRVTVNGKNDAPTANDDVFGNVPPGWTLNPETGHLYKYVSAPLIGWSAAAAAAAAEGGYLATITDAYENSLIFSLVGNRVAWLGGSDAGQEGHWRWVTEPNGSISFTFTAWESGEPNNLLNEDYLATWGNGTWNDLADNVLARLIAGLEGYVIERDGALHDHYLQITEDAPVSFSTDLLLANDTDHEGDQLTISSVSATSQHGASVTLVNGQIVYNASQSSYLQSLAAGRPQKIPSPTRSTMATAAPPPRR